MSRPPVFPVEDKVRIVLSVLAGETTVAEAARKAKVSEQSVGNWKRQFLERPASWAWRRVARRGLPAGRSSSRRRSRS